MAQYTFTEVIGGSTKYQSSDDIYTRTKSPSNLYYLNDDVYLQVTDTITWKINVINDVILLPSGTYGSGETAITAADLADELNVLFPKANTSSGGSGTAGGELTGTYPNPTILNSAILAKVLTGLSVSGSSISAADSILQAFGKLQSQINGVLGGAIYQGVWNATTNSPSLADGLGTKGNYYVVSVAGIRNLGSGNIDFQIGDWAIYNGTIWQKVDNTDAVSSVNGQIGAVSLTTANISELTNLYFTTARVLATQLTGYTSGAGTVSATDTILQAIQKLNGNINTISAQSIPSGGTAGQILTKVNATDYNTTWQDNYADWTSIVKHTVKNDGTSLITKGTPVYSTGSSGTNILVSKASNTSEITSSKTIGLMQSDITTTGLTQTGFVITEGLLGGLNTAGTIAGDPVWLGVNGALIYGLSNKPYAPAHLVFIGIVTKVSAGSGEIFVKIQNGFELKEIHDVDLITNTPTNNQLLSYNSTTSLWTNKSVTTADIAASTNKNYVTDAQVTVIGNTSGTNTGDNAVNSLYSGLATSKQDTLVSGTNIKTINSNSLLGSGNLVIPTTISNGTVATMLASSPSAGTIFYCTDFLIGFHQYDGASWEYLAPTQSEIFFQNFAMGYSQSQTNNFIRGVSGTGAFGDRTLEQTGETKSGNSYYLLTGTTTTGWSQLAGVGSGIGGSPTKLIAFLARVKIPVLSTVSQEFIARIGHPTAGINLTYDRLNRGTTLFLNCNGTFYNTGYVLDTNYHEYVILVDLSALTVRVYVDKVLTFTQTGLSTGLRSNATLFNGFRIDKSAGTTGVNLNIDYTGAWCYKN